MDSVAVVPELKNQTKKQHRGQQLPQSSRGTNGPSQGLRSWQEAWQQQLNIWVFSSWHLSSHSTLQLPPSQCLQEAPETELSRAAKMDLPSTEHSLRAPTSRLQNISQQRQQPQKGELNQKEATVSLLCMCSIAALPCFMALFRVWFDNYADRLYHSYSQCDRLEH